MDKLDNILEAVRRERQYQDDKYGAERHHGIGEWILIMEEELREAKMAWLKECSDDHALEEILQVIAVGFACLQEYRIVERKEIV